MSRHNTPFAHSPISRRQFVELVLAAGLGSTLASCGQPSPPAPNSQEPVSETPGPTEPVSETPGLQGTEPGTASAPTGAAYLAVARGSDPVAITRAALSGIGGIERFVKPDADVIIKPNICVDYRTSQYGATTNPDVVATLVTLCLDAGARRVRVMDSPFAGSPEVAYAKSGIGQAVEAAGGVMKVMHEAKFADTPIPAGRDITTWPVYQDVLTADVVINVPVAKHHGTTRLSLGCKNLMGVILYRNRMHVNLGQRIADLTSLVRPTLTVVDAVRTLMANGPTGGNLDDVRQNDTVIASHDIVAADAYAARLFGLSGADITYVQAAADMGLGTLDLGTIRIEEISV